MPILSAEGISKRFGGVVALNDASFACEPGEIHALLGGNGAGKSTMVKVLCGVQPPDEGVVTLKGQQVRFHSPADANAHGVVPVFQELSLIPDLTVAENLAMGREPRRFGLIDGRIYTLEEIAEFYAISRESVRQIEQKALRKLKQPSRKLRLSEVLDDWANP